MQEGFRLFPESASTFSDAVDRLYLYEVGVSVFFSLLIAALVIFFSIRYRKRQGVRSATHIHGSLKLELLWTVIPAILAFSMFGWGAVLFLDMRRAPADGMEFYVTGKQWMWKIQHPSGHREINTLHVPVGENILLTMTSEDVIHNFFVPAFRVKYDVVPGRYTRAWFQATKTGSFHLFCAEYCGTKHSEMIGKVIVMEPTEYQRWLQGQPAAKDPIEAGAALFMKLRCDTCHAAGSGQRGPHLEGLFGSEVRLKGGGVVTADEEYIRESILEPRKKIKLGFEPLMPTYKGQVNEEEILQLSAYLRSIGAGAEAGEEQGR